MIVVEMLYLAATWGLAALSLNALVLAALYLIHRRRVPAVPPPPAEWPTVAVQLPLYNERHVARRLIKAISGLDYPADRLHIQVLDDSTDGTTQILSRAIKRAQQAGLRIDHVRRADRQGYKAGALAYALDQTQAELIAVFDADFLPPADFLRQVVPYFDDAAVGMVQTRWGHLNEGQNLLTRAQALALDAHFGVEQVARSRSGLLMNFAGTGGVWRRACIEAAGGWQADTLSEDIDLSYRAQLGGWRFRYLPGVAASGEIPPLMMGFRLQQARWATGTVQCLCKLGPRLISARLGLWRKLQALLHLSAYFMHPLMLLILLLAPPLMLAGRLDQAWLAWLGVAALGTPIQSWLAQRHLRPGQAGRLMYFPVLMLVGVGLAVNNTLAVIKGLSGRPVGFKRTPKFHEGRAWRASDYVLLPDLTTALELAAAFYAGAAAALAWRLAPGLVPFMLLYAFGFGAVAGMSIAQGLRARLPQPRTPDPVGSTG